ncbi:MAG: tRNA (adenosine(37)-N6)-threonylcarbamoyltransferase complex transferase subunit TsaD [bacterium]
MILAIETSCDDTCAAVLTPGGKVLSSVITSQEQLHDQYNGVVPELASRRHCELINIVLKKAISRAEIEFNQLTEVAVTYGPGLIGSLLTGIAAAKSIAARFKIPLRPVNHIEAHAFSLLLEHEPEFPFISLVASGGHSMLMHVKSRSNYRLLGRTKDDAAGEAYDKVANMLDLGYPGGPAIQKLAGEGNSKNIHFPRPTLGDGKRWQWQIDDYDFSFSGLKTAVYYFLKENPGAKKADVAAAFQQAVNDCLIHKAIMAAKNFEVPTICVGGGVAANQNLRNNFRQQADKYDIEVLFPSLQWCTDNAAMVGLRATSIDKEAALSLNAQPNLSVLESHETRTRN